MSGKVAVTGASGHIGFHVAAALLSRGYAVELLLREPNFLTARLVRRGARVHKADLLNPETYHAVLSGVDAVFHLAAANTIASSGGTAVTESIVGLTQQVVGTAMESGVATIVYTSSVVVLGRSADPRRLIDEDDETAFAESPYVRGKKAAEHFCRGCVGGGADVRIVYPSWVVGPDDPKCTPPHRLIMDYVRAGQRFYFRGGISVAHVSEVAAAHVAALEQGRAGGRYILGGENVTFRRFYELLAELSNRRPPKVVMPKWLMLAAAAAMKAGRRLLGSEEGIDPKYIEAVVGNYSWYDSGKAVKELNYRIRPIRESLQEAVHHARMRIAGTYQLNGRIQAVGPVAPVAENGLLLITGVPGWLGNRLVDILVNGDRFGHCYPERPVRLLVHPSFSGLLMLPARFEVQYGDITEMEVVRKALAGVVSVFHLAGAIYPPKIETLYKVNAEGTKCLVDACIEMGVRRILFMSTDSVCGRGTAGQRIFDEHTAASPYRHYGKSKYVAESYVLRKSREGKVDGTALRGFWFFGPYAPARQRSFVRMFSWPRQIVFGNGKNRRGISHVDNIVQALLSAENNQATHGKWYWIGDSGDGYEVDRIYQTIAAALGHPYRPVYVPAFVSALLGIADALLGSCGRLHPTIHAAAKFHFDIAGSSAAAMRDFGYSPRVTLEDAAAEMKRMETGN